MVYIDGVQVVNTETDPPYLQIEMTGPEMDLTDDLHELMQDPDLYRDNIRELITLAREYGAIPVFMTQPILYEDNEYWQGIVGGTHWFETSHREFSAATFSRMLGTLNQDLLDVCGEEGVLCFDLARAIDHSSENFYDMMHFTETGAGAVGRALAGYLVGQDFLPGY
jgi:hypothetical protein